MRARARAVLDAPGDLHDPDGVSAAYLVAAAILRQLYAIVTTGQAWNPDIAVHGQVTQSHLEVIAA